MVKIRKAREEDVEVLALLGTVTYAESHGVYIEDKHDLMEYLKSSFAVDKILDEVRDIDTVFYLMYYEGLPIGYAKINFRSCYKRNDSGKDSELERIYILNDYIPLKLGQELLSYIEQKIADWNVEKIWLSVYNQNDRAIRFYRKNGYNEVGQRSFVVNKSVYDNLVFSKNISGQLDSCF